MRQPWTSSPLPRCWHSMEVSKATPKHRYVSLGAPYRRRLSGLLIRLRGSAEMNGPTSPGLPQFASSCSAHSSSRRSNQRAPRTAHHVTIAPALRRTTPADAVLAPRPLAVASDREAATSTAARNPRCLAHRSTHTSSQILPIPGGGSRRLALCSGLLWGTLTDNGLLS
jgi:hypothetical protein